MEGGRRSQREREHLHKEHRKERDQAVPTRDVPDQARPHVVNATIASTPDPIGYAVTFVLLVFGVTFLIVGSIHVKHCSMQPLLPVWLLVLGIFVIFVGVWQAFLVRRIKQNPFRKSSMIEITFSALLFVFYIAWFIAGNIWVYKAWGNQPDYGHYWFGNSCDKSVFFLSFCAIITLDALVGIMLISMCFYCTSKIVVRE